MCPIFFLCSFTIVLNVDYYLHVEFPHYYEFVNLYWHSSVWRDLFIFLGKASFCVVIQ